MHGDPAPDVPHLVDHAQVGDEQNPELKQHCDDADQDRHDQRQLDERLSPMASSRSRAKSERKSDHGRRILVTGRDSAKGGSGVLSS